MASRKSGKRTKSGRPKMTDAQKLQAKIDAGKPNPRVEARQNLFRPFMGDGAIGHEMTCAGRLMLVGAFDGLDATPEEILKALLAYQHGYWGNYNEGQPNVSDYQREVSGRGQNDNNEDRFGEWFDAYDKKLRACGHQTVMAVHSVTVDQHWFPDENVAWADRIITSAIARRNGGQQTATESDHAMLQLVRHGAMELARGREMRKAA